MNAFIEFILSFFKSKQTEQKQEVIKPSEELKVDKKPYLVTEKEILKDIKREDLPKDYQANLDVLLERVNEIRYKWTKSMTVTSGFRSMEDHLRIYREKAEKKQKPFEDGVFNESKVPKQSKHLYCKAVDIYDPGLLITKWLKNNPKILEDAQLWCEEGNSNWVHFQIEPPRSGKRWFNP